MFEPGIAAAQSDGPANLMAEFSLPADNFYAHWSDVLNYVDPSR
jgi:hypothetical protein